MRLVQTELFILLYRINKGTQTARSECSAWALCLEIGVRSHIDKGSETCR